MAQATKIDHAALVEEPELTLISSKESYRRGVIRSTCYGLIASLFVCFLVTFWFDGNSRFAQLAIIPIWLGFGLLVYWIGLIHVDFQHRAAQRRFGKETGKVYLDGGQWVDRMAFEDALQTPGPDQKFAIQMPETIPEAKDLVQITIGKREKATLEVRVLDPVLYAAAQDPLELLTNSFLNYVRFFVNRLNHGMAIFHEKALFETYIELEPLPDPNHSHYKVVKKTHDDFFKLARALETEVEEGKPLEKAFDEEALKSLKKNAGTMRKEARGWGMDVFNIFTPSIDPDGDITTAANQKVAAMQRRKVREIEGETMGRVTKKLRTDLELSGPDAADRYERMDGKPVTRSVSETTLGLSGRLEGAAAASVIGLANAASKKFGGDPISQPASPTKPKPTRPGRRRRGNSTSSGKGTPK